MKAIFLVLLSAFLISCTWVKPTEESRQVSVVKEFNVKDCKRLGSTTSIVTDRLGSLERSPEKVNTELATLAKNEAAKMGGDSVVPNGPTSNGSRKFDIYKCSQ
ncbi:MAG: DUF4156 domain-containing protein [Pseudomonadota bacterium]